VLFWDLARPAAPRRVRETERQPLGLAFAPDGRTWAGSTSQHGVHLWDQAGRLLAELADPDPYDPIWRAFREDVLVPLKSQAVVFSPDGRTLAMASELRVLLWDYHARRLLRVVPLPARAAHHLAFSPTGHLLGVSGGGQHAGGQPVRVYEAATGRLVAELPLGDRTSPQTYGHGLCFSPDGRLLACGDSAGDVRVWAVPTWREVARWAGHRGAVYSVDFAPDGRALASGGQDTTVLLWDTGGLRLPLPTSPAGLDELTARLTAEDAGKAHAAVWALAGRGDAALPRLLPLLRPVPAEDVAAVRRWIRQLGDDRLVNRDEASAALQRLGRWPEPWLRQALADGPPAEVKSRLSRLLRRLESGPQTPADGGPGRAVLAVELIGTDTARTALAELAKGDPADPLTRAARAACDRLARRGR
jgi:hypothetical protein